MAPALRSCWYLRGLRMRCAMTAMTRCGWWRFPQKPMIRQRASRARLCEHARRWVDSQHGAPEMKPEAFVAEVYRRMSLRMVATTRRPPAETMIDAVAREYSSFLPAQK